MDGVVVGISVDRVGDRLPYSLVSKGGIEFAVPISDQDERKEVRNRGQFHAGIEARDDLRIGDSAGDLYFASDQGIDASVVVREAGDRNLLDALISGIPIGRIQHVHLGDAGLAFAIDVHPGPRTLGVSREIASIQIVRVDHHSGNRRHRQRKLGLGHVELHLERGGVDDSGFNEAPPSTGIRISLEGGVVDDVVDRHLGIKRRSVVELDVVAHREFPRVGVRPSPGCRQPGNDREASVLPCEGVVYRDEEAELCRVDSSRVERRHGSKLSDAQLA